MAQEVGIRDGMLFREKADGTSGYWRIIPLNPTVFKIVGGAPTWVDPNGNTIGGWNLDNVAEELSCPIRIDDDWDEASNPIVRAYFEINAAGGDVGDTVDMKLEVYMKGLDEIVTRHQTLEGALIVGTAPQFTSFMGEFEIIFNDVGDPVNIEDIINITINLETDTSEVDTVIINYGQFMYRTLTPCPLRT